MAKLIIVSNRLPLSVKKIDGELEFTASIGGLPTALASYTSGKKSLWIGWPGIAEDDLTEQDKSKITRELRKHNCHPIFLTQAQINGFYNGYSNSVLWPLLHYLEVVEGDTQANWNMYRGVNQLFADTTATLTNPNDIVWIHDYQLLLAPEMLRVQRPQQRIGFFLHIPFPKPSYLFRTPHADQLLRGCLGSDLIGMHTSGYVENFLACCTRSKIGRVGTQKVALSTRIVRVTEFPISIDYDKFARATKTREVSLEYKKLQWKYRGKKVILMSDRLDPTKGLGGGR